MTEAAKKKMLWPWIVLVVVVLAGVGIWFWKFQTYHYAVVKEGVLYRDGNRGMREYDNMIRKCQPKTIVSLLDDKEMVNDEEPQFAEEPGYLKAKNIKLERVKIKLGGWPDAENIHHFLEVMKNPENQPVVVHCAQGVRRTGMMVAAYQMSVLGMSKEQAKEAILTFGHSKRSIGDVEKFIDNYDPKTGAMTAVLADSKE